MTPSKTHYATVERGNESNPYDEWSDTACGRDLDDKFLSNEVKYVTCKVCLKVLNRAVKSRIYESDTL